MLSITFHPCVVSSNLRSNGTYPVKIRVTFKGVSRRLPTNIVATPDDLTRSLHIKSPKIQMQARALINEMQETLTGLSIFTIEDWDVERVIQHIRNTLSAEKFRLDFFEFADDYLTAKGESTRRNYDAALRSFEHFLGKREVDINDITKQMLLQWRASIDAGGKMYYRAGTWKETSKPQNGGTATRHLDKLAHIYRAAQTIYNDDLRDLIPRQPFKGIPKHVPISRGQHSVGLAVIQKALDAVADGDPEAFALGVFVLSFCTMGANMADLWEAHDVTDVWVYNRKKTRDRRKDRAEMRVVVQPHIRGLLERIGARQKGLWLPELRWYTNDKDLCTQKMNASLRRWADREGVEQFTFYAARHTFATEARKLGIEKATIDDCLCHVGDYEIADIYIERNYDLMNEANARVVSCLDFSRLP